MPTVLGKEVGQIGYGLMGFTWRGTPATPSEYTDPLDTSLALGANFWNAGELYGTAEHNSLHLLQEYFTAHPSAAERVLLNVKGCMVPGTLQPDNSEANIRRSVEECLRVLGGTKRIDIFESARVDRRYPIEETIGVLKKLVEEGKIGGIGLSEVDEETIRRAHKIHPIASVEVQLSPFEDSVLHNGVARACADLGIPLLAYSPMGCGLLNGRIQTAQDLSPGDPRAFLPHVFSEEALQRRRAMVQRFEEYAGAKGLTPAQAALNWVLSWNGREGMPVIIPIPGTTRRERLEENVRTLGVGRFGERELGEITEIVKEGA